MIETKDFLPWVLLERDGDAWDAHVLDLDVVTQGDSLKQAVSMATEAAVMTLLHDLNEGLDPARRKSRTPMEAWQRLFDINDKGTRTEDLAEVFVKDASVKAVSMRLWLSFHREVIPADDALADVGFLEEGQPMSRPVAIC